MNTIHEQVLNELNEFKQRRERAESELRNRVDQLEADREAIGGRGSGTSTSAAERKQLDAFARFLREGGKSKAAADDWLAACSTDYQRKAMLIGDGPSGGHAVPEAIEQRIARRVAELNPIRALSRVVQVGTAPSAYKVPVSLGGTAAGWIGETGTRSETATPTLAAPSFPDGELYARPNLSQWAVEDIPNVLSFVEEEVSDVFAATEATAFLTGNGSNRPRGIFYNAPVSTDDTASPQRAAFTLEYVPTDPASPSVSITPDALVELACTLKAGYWPRATWLMNRSTLAVIRKMRGTDGHYLWQPSMAAGMPSTLLGFPVALCDAMPSIAKNALPLLLGDFQRLYCILERPTRVVVDDNVTTPGYVKLFFWKRLSGHVVDDHAGKAGKVAAA